jgi:hypothetical protein
LRKAARIRVIAIMPRLRDRLESTHPRAATSLIVDTVKLTAGTLFNNGVEHTEDIHVVERFRLADPNTLVATQQFTDPGSFVGTAARVLSFTRGPDHVYPYDCDPTYGLAIESRQGPAAR